MASIQEWVEDANDYLNRTKVKDSSDIVWERGADGVSAFLVNTVGNVGGGSPVSYKYFRIIDCTSFQLPWETQSSFDTYFNNPNRVPRIIVKSRDSFDYAGVLVFIGNAGASYSVNVMDRDLTTGIPPIPANSYRPVFYMDYRGQNQSNAIFDNSKITNIWLSVDLSNRDARILAVPPNTLLPTNNRYIQLIGSVKFIPKEDLVAEEGAIVYDTISINQIWNISDSINFQYQQAYLGAFAIVDVTDYTEETLDFNVDVVFGGVTVEENQIAGVITHGSPYFVDRPDTINITYADNTNAETPVYIYAVMRYIHGDEEYEAYVTTTLPSDDANHTTVSTIIGNVLVIKNKIYNDSNQIIGYTPSLIVTQTLTGNWLINDRII
jgi:hypothetical protein